MITPFKDSKDKRLAALREILTENEREMERLNAIQKESYQLKLDHDAALDACSRDPNPQNFERARQAATRLPQRETLMALYVRSHPAVLKQIEDRTRPAVMDSLKAYVEHYTAELQKMDKADSPNLLASWLGVTPAERQTADPLRLQLRARILHAERHMERLSALDFHALGKPVAFVLNDAPVKLRPNDVFKLAASNLSVSEHEAISHLMLKHEKDAEGARRHQAELDKQQRRKVAA